METTVEPLNLDNATTPEAPQLPRGFHTRFTSESARAAAVKSAERRRGGHYVSPEAQEPQTQTPEPTAEEMARNAVLAAMQEQLKLVVEQIARTRKVLNDDRAEWCEHCERGGIAPHHRAQLLKSLDTLLNRQRVLLNVPEPGTAKPPTARRQQDRAEVMPVG